MSAAILFNGASCPIEGSSSAFISTYGNRRAANDLANEYARRGQTAYLYEIRVDSNFYAGAWSAWQFQMYFHTPISLMSLEMANRGQEWDVA